MATATELDVLAREALYYVEREHATVEFAKRLALNAHKDIKWTDGIMRAIGERMTAIKKTREPKSRVFTTHIEKTISKNEE